MKTAGMTEAEADARHAQKMANKKAARDRLWTYLSDPPDPGTPRRYVRLNRPASAELFAPDLACAMTLDIEGIGLPKIQTADEVRTVDAALTTAVRATGTTVCGFGRGCAGAGGGRGGVGTGGQAQAGARRHQPERSGVSRWVRAGIRVDQCTDGRAPEDRRPCLLSE